MRKIKSIISILSLIVISSCSPNPTVPEGEYLIEGKLTNVPDSVVLQLIASNGKSFKKVAVDTVIGGVFTFSDTISGVNRFYLSPAHNESRISGYMLDVWAAPNQLIEVKGESNLLKIWSVNSDIQEQKEENAFVKTFLSEQREIEELSIVENDFIQFYFDSERNEVKDKKIWAKIDSIREIQDPVRVIVDNKGLEYLKNTPISNHWLHTYLDFAKVLEYEKESPKTIKIKELYSLMSDTDKQTDLGKQISEYMDLPEAVEVGDDMVDGDLYDIDGKLQHLSQFKGRYILLDFWSTGCGPCIRSIPELAEIEKIYKDKLVVISISLDPKKHWQEYVKENNMKSFQWNELKNVPRLAVSYGVRGIPHYTLISPESKVQSIWKGYGTGSLKRKMKKEIK